MRVIKEGAFEQECQWCRTIFQFRYMETYRTRDYQGELNAGQFVRCPSCKQGQRADLS
jgi:hypothetical protein